MTREEIHDILSKSDCWGSEHAPELDEMVETCEWYNRQVPIKSLEAPKDGCWMAITFERVPNIQMALSMGNLCSSYDTNSDETVFTLWWD